MKKTFALIALASLTFVGCSSKDSDTGSSTTECPTPQVDAGSDAETTSDAAPDAEVDAETDAAPVDGDAGTDAATPPADAAAE